MKYNLIILIKTYLTYKGLGVHCFDTKDNKENFLPLMKERFQNFATKFECKFTIETGILSPELTKIYISTSY